MKRPQVGVKIDTAIMNEIKRDKGIYSISSQMQMILKGLEPTVRLKPEQLSGKKVQVAFSIAEVGKEALEQRAVKAQRTLSITIERILLGIDPKIEYSVEED